LIANKKVVMTIEIVAASVLTAIKTTGFFAPFAFILFHVLRQFLLIPVAVVCVAGGILFGGELGSLYSVIGLTCASMTFYLITKMFPALLQRFVKMKVRWLGAYVQLSVGQIIILRMIPFINFSLISLLILEKVKTFRGYAKLSLLTHIPSALCFTFLGTFIQTLSPVLIIVLLSVLVFLVYFFREKQVMIKWYDFFVPAREKSHDS
jgi:uncharacterized membrane protein YdjX (TVP38/TMEM64 family)